MAGKIFIDYRLDNDRDDKDNLSNPRETAARGPAAIAIAGSFAAAPGARQSALN
jgi:hypothetical protein